MSHEVETMAYTNEVPWHGLGTYIADAPDVDTMIKEAKLDWNVSKVPLQFVDEDNTTHEVERHYALVRDTDKRVFDIAGEIYTPCQNREAFEFFVDFIEDGKATLETAGSLRNGLHVWGLANLQAGFTLGTGDEVKGYLLVVCPHEVGKSLIFKFTPIRVVCQNTLSLALSSSGHGEFRMPHRSTFDDKAIARAREALGVAREAVGELEVNAQTLKSMKLSDSDFISKILAPIYMPNADTSELSKDFEGFATPRMKTIMDVYRRAPGADPGNGWGALNAVTYHADHLASRTTDKRLTNAWLGKTANQKNKALEMLLEMAQ